MPDVFSTDVTSVIEDITSVPVISESTDSLNNESESTEETQERTCRECGTELQDDEIECPQCGTINLDRKRRRRNRPTREVVREVASDNYNGIYRIYRNSDGTLSCDCLSFLFQRGIRSRAGFATCKHIRLYLDTHNVEVNLSGVKPVSEWQKAALKRFGVEVNEYLTNAQAYFIFEDLLKKQGVEYREYENLLLRHSNVSLLPIYSFGVEFEMSIRSRNELKRKMQEAGIPAKVTNYSHELTTEWKLGRDSSITPAPGHELCELTSPKLFGSEGFKTIEKVLKLVKETEGKVNRSCGTHVHVDAWNWSKEEMVELIKVWMKIEVPFVWYLVSPSRRNNRQYAMMVDDDLLIRYIEDRLFPEHDRYYSLNVCAFQRHGTVEFRIHNGTINPRKIIPWIIFCLKLVDAVKRGLRHTDITDISFNAVMDAIGMDASATSVIRDARNYLYGRYMHWKEDAERNPGHIPDVTPPVVNENMVRARELQRELERLQSVIAGLQYSYAARRRRMTERDETLPVNSVVNLAHMIPSSVIPIDRYEESENGWRVPSRSGNTMHDVVLNSDDTLTCNCRAFRRQQYCWHSINLARFIAMRRQIQEHEQRRAEIRAEMERLQNNQEETTIAA